MLMVMVMVMVMVIMVMAGGVVAMRDCPPAGFSCWGTRAHGFWRRQRSNTTQKTVVEEDDRR